MLLPVPSSGFCLLFIPFMAQYAVSQAGKYDLWEKALGPCSHKEVHNKAMRMHVWHHSFLVRGVRRLPTT